MRIKVGDKVAYAVKFLASIGMRHTDMAHARGVVTTLRNLSADVVIADIDWGSLADELPGRVITANLAIVGPNRRFCNCD